MRSDLDHLLRENNINIGASAFRRFSHELAHQMFQKHNYQYRERRDCCGLVHELGIDFPTGRDLILNQEDRMELIECLDDKFSNRISWRELSDPDLVGRAMSGGVMSISNLIEDYELACGNSAKMTLTNPTRFSMTNILSNSSRINIVGGRNRCVLEEANQAPEIREFNFNAINDNGWRAKYNLNVRANDPDIELFQARGEDGRVFFDNTLMYEYFDLSFESNPIYSLDGFFPEIIVNQGFTISRIRAYDQHGAYDEEKHISFYGNFLDIRSSIDLSQIPLATLFEFNIRFNQQNNRLNKFIRGERELDEEIEIIINYGEGGNEIHREMIEDLSFLYREGITLGSIYHRSGNQTIQARLRIGEFISPPVNFQIQVVRNNNPRLIARSVGYGANHPFNQPVEIIGVISEPDLFQNTEIRIDYGDGTVEQIFIESLHEDQVNPIRVFRDSHQYAEPGIYRVEIELIDNLGGISRYHNSIRVAVEVELISYQFPQIITPGDNLDFFAQASSPHPNAGIRFNYNFGDNNRRQVDLTQNEARNGEIVSHLYQNLMPGEIIPVRLEITSSELTYQPVIIEENLEVVNVSPQISYTKYSRALSQDEMLAMMPAEDARRFRESADYGQRRDINPNLISFFIRYNDANGPLDHLSTSFRFSDGGGVESKVFIDRNYLRVDHSFDQINENQWMEIRVCDLSRSCTERRVFLNRENLREPLEEIRNLELGNNQNPNPFIPF
jgi:hypothetical protein